MTTSNEPSLFRRLLAVLVCAGVVATFGACGGGGTPLGEVCSTSADCAKGLTCIQQNNFDPTAGANGGCKAGDKYCSVACTTDADCTKAVGAGHVCIGAGGGPTDCAPGMCFMGVSG